MVTGSLLVLVAWLGSGELGVGSTRESRDVALRRYGERDQVQGRLNFATFVAYLCETVALSNSKLHYSNLIASANQFNAKWLREHHTSIGKGNGKHGNHSTCLR